MIEYRMKDYDNIYLENGYKVYMECIKIEDVRGLYTAIEQSALDDGRNIFYRDDAGWHKQQILFGNNS